MRKLLLFVALLAIAPLGCQHTHLKVKTVNQASTLAAIHQQQVVDNLAVFAKNPDAMPYFVTADGGVTTIDRHAEVGSSFAWDYVDPKLVFKSLGVDPGVSSSATEQWSTTSLNNPNGLKVMRCVYQSTIGHCLPECKTLLTQFYNENPAWVAAMQPGWYGVGSKHQVPKDACYVSENCGTFVWVSPSGMDSLTKVTFAILDVATLTDEAIHDRVYPPDLTLDKLNAEAIMLTGLIKDFPKDNQNDIEKAQLTALRARLATVLAMINKAHGEGKKLVFPSNLLVPSDSMRKRNPVLQIPLTRFR